MKHSLFAFIFLSLVSQSAAAEFIGSTSVQNGRLKIQISQPVEKSQGSFALRKLLEATGFKEKDGFVETKKTLAPLELYNYLYKNGRYVFTILIPVSDRSFVQFREGGFISFDGIGASRLFAVFRRILEPNYVNGMVQYRMGNSYCDYKKVDEQYRCWISI